MPKVNLTSRFCMNAKVNPGEVQTDWFDEEVSGLALRVSATRKAWTLHFTSPANGKRSRMKLGGYPMMSLAQARTRAREAKTTVEAGKDPRGTTGGTMTIADLVESFLANHVKINLRTAPEIERRLRKNIIPVIGSVPLAELHRRDVNRIVEPILRRDAPLEATRAFEDLRSMVRWAVARGDIDHNPIDGMKKPATSKPRERVLTDDEMRALWHKLPMLALPCQRIIKLCLLTGQRVGEIVGMTQGELDLKRKIWSLPGSRTKNGHAHSVPLSGLALGVIEEAMASSSEFVFGPINVNIVGKAIARTKWGIAPWTAHDLRRTALTKMAELGVAPIVLGHVANHRTTTKAGMTLSVYVHHQYEKEKREALELWADRLRGIVEGGAEVVPMRGKQ